MFNCDLQSLEAFAFAKRTSNIKHLIQLYQQSADPQVEAVQQQLSTLSESSDGQSDRYLFKVQFFSEYVYQLRKKNIKVVIEPQLLQYTVENSLEFGHASLLAITALLKISDQDGDLMKPYFNRQLLLETVMIPEDDDRFVQKISALKFYFTICEIHGIWAKKKNPEQLRNLIFGVYEEIIDIIYFDSEVSDPMLLDERLRKSSEQIRQIMFAWVLITFDQCPEAQAQFKKIFSHKYTQNKLTDSTIKLSSQECVKIIDYVNMNQKIDLKDPIFSSQRFWDDMVVSFCTFDDLTNSKICMHLITQILNELPKQHSQVQKRYKSFVDSYTLLDNYADFLTRPVWDNLGEYLQPIKSDESQIISQILAINPIKILLRKALNHPNPKTTKNCLKKLLTHKLDNQYLGEVIVALNSGRLYNDAPEQVYSKFYKNITTYFRTQVTFNSQEDIIQLISYIVGSISDPHAVFAFGLVIANLNNQIKINDYSLLSKLKHFLSQNLEQNKQILLIKNVIIFILNHYEEIAFEVLEDFLITLAPKLLDLYRLNIFQTLSTPIKHLLNLLPAEQAPQIKNLELNIVQYLLLNDLTYIQKYLVVNGLYSNAYQSQENKLEILSNLNQSLEFVLRQSDESQMAYIYKTISQQSDELFGFINSSIQDHQDQSPQHQPIIQDFINNVWVLGLDTRFLNETGPLTSKMTKFIALLFKQILIEKQFHLVHYLIAVYQASNTAVKLQIELNQPILVEELLLKHGQEVAEILTDTQSQFDYVTNVTKLLQTLKLDYQWGMKYLTSKQTNQKFYQLKDVLVHDLLQITDGTEAIIQFDQIISVGFSMTDGLTQLVQFILDPKLATSQIFQLSINQKLSAILKNPSPEQARVVITQLTGFLEKHPHQLREYMKILVKLVKKSDRNNFKLTTSEQYIPPVNLNNLKSNLDIKDDFQMTYARFQIFALLDCLAQQSIQGTNQGSLYQQLIDLVLYVIDKSSTEKYDQGFLESNKHFRIKQHLWQLVCCLKKIFNKGILFILSKENLSKLYSGQIYEDFLVNLMNKIWSAFYKKNHPNVRQYMEVMIVALTDQYPQIWLPNIINTLQDRTVRTNIMIPMVFIGSVHMRHFPIEENMTLFNKIFPMVSSNVAYIRSLSQTCCLGYIKKMPQLLKDEQIREFVGYFETNKECQKIIKNIDTQIQRYEKLLDGINQDGTLSIQYDTFGEIIQKSIIKKVKNLEFASLEDQSEQTSQVLSESNKQQQKIDLIYDNFWKFNSFTPRPTVRDLIVVATFLDRMPNFGHMTRTCENFGAKEVTFPSNKIFTEDSYNEVSSKSQNYMPVVEIKELYLMEYLYLKKSQGYKIIGVEQTSQSQNIVNFQFPEKSVLVLGREKTGIPIEYIELMDVCVEIPQFGVIRSLNVHVSALICIYQYVQQQKYGH